MDCCGSQTIKPLSHTSSFIHHLTLCMAYNNREWDRGKDSWDDSGTSGAWDNRGAARDDYYNDGKRRKFNNGVGGSLYFLFSQGSLLPRDMTTLMATRKLTSKPAMHRSTPKPVPPLQAHLAKSAYNHRNLALMSFFLAWTQTLPRQMSVAHNILA
jgi:hypothetical protein